MKMKLIILCLVLGFTACGHRGGPPGGGMPQGGFAMPVSAAPLTIGTIADSFTVTSTVTPLQHAQLSSVVSGNVLFVGPQIGERVHKGELLVKIDDRTTRAQLAQASTRMAQIHATNAGGSTTAQANLTSAKVGYDTAKANLARNQQLFNQGYVSKQALDQIRQATAAAQAVYNAALATAQNANLQGDNSAAVAEYKNAQAMVQQFEVQLEQTNVSAPFDGVVTARNVDPGTLASPGTVLMEVAQLDPVFIDAGISGADLQNVRVGKPVTVTVDSIPGRVWHAQVAYLSLASVTGTLTYPARVRVANPDLALRGGMVANVAIERTRKTGVLLAPRAAVYQTDAGYAMFIIDQGKAKTIPVEVGLENDQQAQVNGQGIKPGVMAILNHSVTLQPGTPVQVMPPGGGAPGGGPPGGGPPNGASKGKSQPTKSPQGKSY